MNTELARPGEWVAAAPFRAYLLHLCSAAALPWQAVAIHADVPERVAHALLFGRLGRPLQRLAPDLARRLLCLSEASLATLTGQPVAAGLTKDLCRQLRKTGMPNGEIARQCQIRTGELDHIMNRSTNFTTRRIELLALTLAVKAGVVDWPDTRLRREPASSLDRPSRLSGVEERGDEHSDEGRAA